ncbi:hypothetical protein [Oceanobacillus sp. FSL K6-0251]|uniref:hypothetical protein n=1 Tax=Oceanobacillus sp. FSL K6-0251 TaxID=2921602 RepID=UPI0030FBB27C
MRLKKSYFAVPGISLLLLLGACQGEDDTSQAETEVPHQEQESDEEALSESDKTEDNQETTENIQEDAESEDNINEEKQTESNDNTNREDAYSEEDSKESENTTDSNITETNYSSRQEAVDAIDNYEVVEQTNLGLIPDIQALSDAGAGSQYISWNMGNWMVLVRAPTDPELATGNYKDAEDLARDVVDYLETNYLPAPDERGVIQINDSGEAPSTNIRWQQGNTVYEIDESIDNPIDALQIAVESAS